VLRAPWRAASAMKAIDCSRLAHDARARSRAETLPTAHASTAGLTPPLRPGRGTIRYWRRGQAFAEAGP
jgi:hypothetical protein